MFVPKRLPPDGITVGVNGKVVLAEKIELEVVFGRPEAAYGPG